MDTDKLDKKNKIILISGISFASLTMLAAIVSACITPEAPDPKLLGDRQKVVYMASKEFSRLPEQEKMNYMRKVGHSRRAYRQLNNEERRAVAKNTRKIMRKRMREELDKFFELSEEEQNKKLDEMIDRMDKWRKARKAREANNSNGSNNSNNSNNSSQNNSDDRRVNHNAFRQGILENTDSTTRAKMSEFFKKMRERAKQRGK